MTILINFYDRAMQPLADAKWQCHALQFGWHVLGGCHQANLLVQGAAAELFNLPEMLGCGIMLRDGQGLPLWWGYVHALEINAGSARVCTSLSELANRVAVHYRLPVPLNMQAAEMITGWAGDEFSQRLYGVHELLVRGGEMDEARALARRDLLLAQRAFPRGSLKNGADAAPLQAHLLCRGWFESLAWKTWAEDAGLVMNTPSPAGQQALADGRERMRLAQSFAVGKDWSLQTVQIKLRKVGYPADDILCQIAADDNGKPGTVLAQSSVSDAVLNDHAYSWLGFAFDPPLALTAGNVYWLVFSKAGGVHVVHHYAVQVDENLSFSQGRLKVYDDYRYDWVSRALEADLIFQVHGVKSTTDQIATIYGAANQFLSGLDVQCESGVATLPFRRGLQTAAAEICALLQCGSADQRLLLATVTPQRVLTVTKQPQPGEADWQMDAEGRFWDEYGTRQAVYASPVGRWLGIKALRAGIPADAPAVFVSHAVYDAVQSRMMINP